MSTKNVEEESIPAPVAEGVKIHLILRRRKKHPLFGRSGDISKIVHSVNLNGILQPELKEAVIRNTWGISLLPQLDRS